MDDLMIVFDIISYIVLNQSTTKVRKCGCFVHGKV